MKILNIIQIISALLLIAVILMQKQGSGLGGAFGGEGNTFSTKRGAEKTLFYLTIIFSIIFLGSALLSVIL